MNPRAKIDRWVCRDVDGVLHVAKVERYFDDHNKLVQMQGCTACRPVTSSCTVLPGSWGGTKLPPLTLGNQWGYDRITLIEFWVREAPTCVRCAAVTESM